MTQTKKTPKWYLISSVIYSAITIATVIIFFDISLIPLVSILWLPVIIFWFFLNIVALLVFALKKFEKISIVLPALYLIDSIFSSLLGLIIGIIAGLQGISSLEILRHPLMILASIILPVVSLGLSIKLLKGGNGKSI